MTPDQAVPLDQSTEGIACNLADSRTWPDGSEPLWHKFESHPGHVTRLVFAGEWATTSADCYRIATGVQNDASPSPEDPSGDLTSCVVVQRGGDVAVGLQRDGDRRVAQALLHDPGMHAAG